MRVLQRAALLSWTFVGVGALAAGLGAVSSDPRLIGMGAGFTLIGLRRLARLDT